MENGSEWTTGVADYLPFMDPTVAHVPLTPNAFDEHVLGRMLEFATPATPWYRRLWHSGPVLTAAELLEAGGLRGGIAAKRELQADLVTSLRDDAGLGPHARAIRAALPKDARDLVIGGHSWHALTAARAQAATGYLSRWAAELRKSRGYDEEFVACRLAAHLLDHGWSASHLHRWTTFRIVHRPTLVELPDILEEADADLSSPDRVFSFCVPLAQAPPTPRPTPQGWLTGRGVAAWRQANIPDAQPIRQYGAVLMDVSAPDVYSAADDVRSQVAGLVTRFAVGGRKELRFGPDMWVAGRPNPLPIEGSPRRVEVHAFERLERLFALNIPAQLASSLALIEPLDRGAPVAAITGSWAAMEALMVGPADGARSTAADRLALIVAASYLRAELTAVAWAHARTASDPLAASISAAVDNRSKAELAERAIAASSTIALQRATDRWALGRVTSLQPDPRRGVLLMQAPIRRAFLRLYRQRNMIVHGGRTDAVGIEAALRIAAPLVGAGLDRVAHAALDRGIEPLVLAATARIRLETLTPATAMRGSGVVDLLT